jgi:L-asparaginase
MARKRIALISTGGTIEKTYNELEGVLHNQLSVLDVMLASLTLEGVEIVRVPLLNKDSIEMTDADHLLIARTAGAMAEAHDGVLIVHGTDRLADTGERVHELVESPPVPIVLTGALRPYQLRNSDAEQNLTEALLAVQILPPGVYVVIHNKVLEFPGVVKDRQRGTFVRPDTPRISVED